MEFKGTVPALKVSAPPLKTVRHIGPNGHWDFPEQMGNGVGFIYVIYDTVLNKAYLGKKQFLGMGKLNRGQESNWKKYTSSSKVLNELLKHRPREEFEFICIEQYKTKGTLSYSESWSLCLVEAPTTDEWYNTLIEKVSWPVKEKITDRHKQRLQAVMKRLIDAKGS
jgi:hypothetical protein